MGPPDTWGREWSGSDDLPALPRLIHRILESPRNVSFLAKEQWNSKQTGQERKRYRHIHTRGNRTKKRTMIFIDRAYREDCQAVVILIDRDSEKKGGEFLDQMQQGRNEMQKDENYPPCAVGVAVEEFDAWFICHPDSVEAAGGDPQKCSSNPESISDAKNQADNVYGTRRGMRLSEKYKTAAGAIDLGFLAERCPDGFAVFRKDVETRIVPLFK
jgi:hypothetical protein